MRALIFALAVTMLAAPAMAGQCKFYNDSGQSLEWTGESVIVDPLYTPKFICPLTPIPNTDAFTANCGTWSDTLVVGYAKNDSGAEALVWQNIFFWRKCDDHA